ncbi:MAG: CCA tRNA nucleotidyltransferase [Chloroflexi bacterium]|nr:CCA tRNA nucleotidyltransferase [Chloroflexota bacterium]
MEYSLDLVDKGDLKLFTRPKESLLLNNVSKLLAEQGIRSYLVGGFVRDALLERDTVDIDIAVAADALEVAPRVATAFGGKYVLLDEVNRVGRVILAIEGAIEGQRELDFSTLKDNIKQDLSQRDFTIDAMAVNLGELAEGYTAIQLIDPFDGLGDLRRGVIRAVSSAVFKSDAARLLRAARLASELGFSIDTETEALIRGQHHLIASVAGERIREELLRLLAIPQSKILRYLDELGLLTAMIPELNQLKGVEQPKEHFWDVFDHSIKTVDAVDFILRQGEWEYGSEEALVVVPWSATLARHFELEVSSGSTRRSLLKMAALLHDIAKPQAKAIDESGRMRFLGHAKEGAAIAVNILERLRFSSKEVRLVEIMVRHHLRPGQMGLNELPSPRAIYRYFRDTGEAGIDVLFLSLADHLATRGPRLEPAQWREHAQMVEYVLNQRCEQESLIIPPKLVDGNDLIDIFGMSPGPQIGQLLEAVQEAQATGELTSRQEALCYIGEKLATEAV